ncbi:MAG: S8 family serine peptidase [Candidatus Eremiobacterota bacterium]
MKSRLASVAAEAAHLQTKLNDHVEGEVIVKLKPGQTGFDDFAEEYGGSLLHKFDIPREIYQNFGGDLLHIKLPAGMTAAEGIALMSRDARVAYAATNDVLHHTGRAEPVLPNDLDPRLWGLNNTGQDGGKADADIDAPEAWGITTGTRAGGPVIAVIDTGVDYNHDDLKNNIWTNAGEVPGDGVDNDGNGVVDDVHGYNAINGSGNPMDDHYHGTHCAGTIAGEGNNGQGVTGVMWQGQIMPVKFLSSSGSGTLADAVKAILYAGRNGARITSNSWGGGGYNQALYDALKNTPQLHIFAAGNSSSNNDSRPAYPASYDLPNIVAVAASDRNDAMASFSNYGARTVDLAAPGKDVYSTSPNNGYRNLSGTSMATPHVSGVAGLIASAYPGATNEQIKARLINSVDKVAAFQGRMVSGGRLNAARALEQDGVAPAAPNDLRASAATASSIELSWTATGDDGWCGQASGYDLRLSDKPIVEGEAAENQVSFDEALSVPGPDASVTGTIESARVSVPLSAEEKTYYVAMKVADNVGNRSEMRSVEVRVPAAKVAFQDDMDGEPANWTPEGTWGQVEVEGRGKVWTDSPAGNYDNNVNTALTSRAIDLTGLAGSTLVFDSKIDCELSYDKAVVEVSEDGQTWAAAAEFTGQEDWKKQQVDLSAFDGKSVQVRFRFQADSSQVGDGFYLDNVMIAGSPA